MKHVVYSALAGLFGVLLAFTISTGFEFGFHSVFDRAGTVVYQAAALPLIPLRLLPTPVRLTFVGDVMLDRGVRQSVIKNGNGDYVWLFEKLGNGFDNTILFGNLEGPLSDQGADRHNLYSFRMKPSSLLAIKQAGFQVLSVANNHIGDWGREAFVDTLNRLNDSGILPVGGGGDKSAAVTPQIIEQNGQRIGYLAFTDVGPNDLAAATSTPGILLASDPDFSEIVSQAATQVDALVVAFHWGVEYQTQATARQRELAHRAIEAGARLVIGSHPHVVQEIENYQGGLIAYSLGNFIFDQPFSPNTMQGMVLTVDLIDGKIVSADQQTVSLDADFRPGLNND